jgi:hypothetical protein
MTNTGVFFNWYPSSEQHRFSQPTRHLLALPPLPQPPAPVLAVVTPVAPPQGTQADADAGEEQYVAMPELHLVESSDEDNSGEDAASDLPSPASVNQAGPPPLVEAPEEEEEGQDQGQVWHPIMEEEEEDDDDFEMDEMDDPDVLDEMQLNITINGDGTPQSHLDPCSYSDILAQA